MFDIGSKVMVVASNLQRGDTGPRKGSVGYIVQSLMHEQRISSSSPPLSVIPIHILFNRFGYESNRDRMEYKIVNNVIPITFLNDNMYSVKDTIKLINDKKATKKAFDSMMINNSHPASIVVPMDNMGLLNDDIEFKHWVLAHILSEDHTEVIETFCGKKKAKTVCNKAGLDLKMISDFVEMRHSPDFRSKALKTLLAEKQKAITTIRILFQMYYRHQQDVMDKQLDAGQFRLHKDDGSVRFDMIYNLLLADLFRPGRFESYTPVIMEKMNNNGCRNVLQYLLKLREELVSLARCAVEGPGVEVKKVRKK